MPVLINHLAKKVGLKSKDLMQKINDLGFKVSSNQKEIPEDIADLIYQELQAPQSEEDKSAVEIYEEIYEKKLEKELVKSQRKQTAGQEKKVNIKEKEEDKIEVSKYKTNIEIPLIISVKVLAEKTGISAAKIIGELMKNGILASINQEIDIDTATIICSEFGIKVKRIHEASIEDVMERNLSNILQKEDRSDLKERPPIVCVMGHVDHGKTQLLDYIRDTKVVSQEKGGITQHIGAYEVEKNGKKITFIDTPGHEAFTAMRARGAKITDIAILVVSADEGVKEQTIEAINHAKEANVPIIVAMTKIDKDKANIEKVKSQLNQHGLQPEDWGGKTIIEPISSITGEGIDRLLDDILILAELIELKANPSREAVATVIEAHLDPSLGPTASIIINTGILHVMDNVIIGPTFGRIKVIINSLGKRVKTIGPSQCAKIAGLEETPLAGDILQVVDDEKSARKKATQIKELIKLKKIKTGGLALNEIIARINEGKLKTLKLILKTDTKGSLEAIQKELSKLHSEDVAIQIIHYGVGQITESDVLMASASKGIIIGFNSKPNFNVKKLAERENVEILYYEIIYQIIEEMKKLLSGLLEPEIIEKILGKLEIKKIFYSGKKEMIVGGKVIEGKIENKAKYRLIQENSVRAKGDIVNLKLINEQANEVFAPKECGLKVTALEPLHEGDVLEIYGFEKHIKTLS